MWYLRTLGGLSLETDGRTSPSASRRRPLALLALLAIAGEQGSSREKLAALLWPESDEEHGGNALGQVLVSLRRGMPEDPVVGSAELRLNPSIVTSDVADFERCVASGALERAVELYHGQFLDGFHVREAAEFERWAEQHRRRLHDMCVSALARLARAADGRSSHEAAIGWWKRYAALEPTNAHAVSGLMRALAKMGDGAGAQRQYRIYEELMRQEFGFGTESEVASLAVSLASGRAISGIAKASAHDPGILKLVSDSSARGDTVRSAVRALATNRGVMRRVVAVASALVAIGGLSWIGVIAARS